MFTRKKKPSKKIATLKYFSKIFSEKYFLAHNLLGSQKNYYEILQVKKKISVKKFVLLKKVPSQIKIFHNKFLAKKI